MKKYIIAVLSVVLSFSFCGCDEYEPETEEFYDDYEAEFSEVTTVTEQTEESEKLFEAVTIPPDNDYSAHIAVQEKETDYYSMTDETFKSQISMIADKFSSIAEEHEYALITDLDGNGRAELILYLPDMVIYEVSENRDSLIKTVTLKENVPELSQVSERLMLTDTEGKRHYVWNTYSDDSSSVIRESESDFLYENGILIQKAIRFRKYDMFAGGYIGYGTETGDSDYKTYSAVLADMCYRRGYSLKKYSMGLISISDITGSDDTEKRQLFAQSLNYFSVKDAALKYNYTDLDGTWKRSGTVFSGDETVQGASADSFSLVFHDDMYETIITDSVKGEMKNEPKPVAFRFDTSYETELWCASLADNEILKNAVIRISSDGTLLLRAQITDSSGQIMPVEWTFEKNGWTYQLSSETETIQQPVTENSGKSAETELSEKAMAYYERKTSYRPGHAEVNKSEDEWIYTVRLYDDFEDHTATSAWYTIDIRYMTGSDLMTGEAVDLNN